MTERIEYDALVPLGARLLVKPDPLVMTHGSIVRPENIYQRAHSGEILAIGEDCAVENRRGLKVGDHIGWGPHAGVELTVRGETYYLLDNTEPWGLIDPLPERVEELREAGVIPPADDTGYDDEDD